MKVAYISMGPFDKDKDYCLVKGGQASLYTVANMEEAIELAQRLEAEGLDLLELCGAFEEEGARQIIQATGGRLPVGYVVHFPEQEELFKQLFSRPPKK